jgi:hypothetical protein
LLASQILWSIIYTFFYIKIKGIFWFAGALKLNLTAKR